MTKAIIGQWFQLFRHHYFISHLGGNERWNQKKLLVTTSVFLLKRME